MKEFINLILYIGFIKTHESLDHFYFENDQIYSGLSIYHNHIHFFIEEYTDNKEFKEIILVKNFYRNRTESGISSDLIPTIKYNFKHTIRKKKLSKIIY